MSTKIYANARFGFREDTLENWTKENPILEKGEPAVVRDGQNGEWLKIGDGATAFNNLPWKKGPQGEKGDQGVQGPKGDKGEQGVQGVAGKDAVTDQIYDPNSENAQSGKAVANAINDFALTKQKNYELISTIKVTPDVDGKLPTVIRFNMDSNGNPLELTDFCLSMVLGVTDGASAKLRFNLNGKLVFGSVNPGLTKALQSWYINYMDLGSGKLYIAPNDAVVLQTHLDQGTPYVTGFIGNVLPPTFNGYSPVTNIYIGIPDGIEKTFIEGSEFKLYGVRK